MHTFQEILPFVNMPTRYIGDEINSIKKDFTEIKLKFALAFPDLYEIGTSHFGMQILYTILNQNKYIAAERFFTPAPDMEKLLERKQIPLLSLESKINLKDFDIIGFSLLYELNFTNILTMLNLSKIPFYAEKRDETFPLIIGGGPCAFNPEPLADFFDAFVVGDGEDVILKIADIFIQWKKNGDGRKKTILKLLSNIDGVYIPCFFIPTFNKLFNSNKHGIQILEPKFSFYTKVKKACLPNISQSFVPINPIVPFAKPVHDRLRLEIARGCSKGCRFCQAGMIYRPVRERKIDDLVEIAKKSLKSTGYSDISLLSLSVGDYSNIEKLMENLLIINQNYCTSIFLPSIRADRLTPQLMKIIKKVRKTGFTIAPEAGTQRLRNVINKNITEQDIFETVTNAFNLGWRNIKLYFMNGLPTETQLDIESICELSNRLLKIKTNGKSKINISFAAFIPKSHTPFQSCEQISIEKSVENLNYLKQNLKHPRIKLKWQNPEMSFIEGVWARGDRKLAPLLVAAWEKGCRLDGWSNMFKKELWDKAFSKTGIDPCFYTLRKRNNNEILPWDHIKTGISKAFLKQEFQKAMNQKTTSDCRDNECSVCGICDFKEIKPVLYDSEKIIVSKKQELNILENYIKFRFFYEKLGNAKYFGHLEFAKIIKRAIRRTGIKIKYSKGFNPSMKLAFDNPLPVGMESQEESFTLYAEPLINIDTILKKLNQTLPGNISIIKCIKECDINKKSLTDSAFYKISLNNFSIDKSIVENFMSLSKYILEKTNFKGKIKKIDIRKATGKINFIDAYNLEMELIKYQNKIVRPSEILAEIFKVPEKHIKTAKILKLKV
ncbi:MAG: B12-binding domain-containing radical SAM protein [Desulfobacteraceae bacterium 4572_130]|nr:MAG: B12-binding domain-containing radical SAM protein [Desulfobacteraceae bacterium 4572_130]